MDDDYYKRRREMFDSIYAESDAIGYTAQDEAEIAEMLETADKLRDAYIAAKTWAAGTPGKPSIH